MMSVEAIAEDRADWLVDAAATATQNRMLLRGDPSEDKILTEALKANAKKAIVTAVARAMANTTAG